MLIIVNNGLYSCKQIKYLVPTNTTKYLFKYLKVTYNQKELGRIKLITYERIIMDKGENVVQSEKYSVVASPFLRHS